MRPKEVKLHFSHVFEIRISGILTSKVFLKTHKNEIIQPWDLAHVIEQIIG